MKEEIKLLKEKYVGITYTLGDVVTQMRDLYMELQLQYEDITNRWTGKSGTAFAYLCWNLQLNLDKGREILSQVLNLV